MLKHGRKMSEEEAKKEIEKIYSERSKMAEHLLNKWRRTDILGPSISKMTESQSKRFGRAAIAVSNQEKVFKLMTEQTYSTTFGNSIRPEHMLRAVFLGAANSHRGDIFTEYPLVTTDDALFYIQATADKTLRGTTKDDRLYETMNPWYSGEEHYENALGTFALGPVTLTTPTYVPLIPFSIRVTLGSVADGGGVVAVDDGNGKLVGKYIDTLNSSVDYLTGIVIVAFTTAPPNASAIGTDLGLSYQWNSELQETYWDAIANPNDPSSAGWWATVSLELKKIRFNARPMPLGYRISDMTQIMFETTGLGDAKGYLADAIAQEHARARDYRALAKARQVALTNVQKNWDCNFMAAGEISFKSHAQRIINVIEGIGSNIYDEIKRGGINKIVAGAQATTYMKNHDLWTDDASEGTAKNGLYRAGSLSNMEVYTCPAQDYLVKTNELMLVYKNPVEGMDTSIVFGNLTEIDSSLRYPNFITEGNTATVEDSKVINHKFVRLLTLDNLPY